jgi:hypothetical protein
VKQKKQEGDEAKEKADGACINKMIGLDYLDKTFH